MNSIRKLSRTLTVTVHYLNGELELEMPWSSIGKDLFSLVCVCLGVRHFWYFGLQYPTRSGHLGWLRPQRKLQDILPKRNSPLYFLVKYFPEEITKLNDETAISLIYSQCKNEILSGGIFCPAETCILLASYVLQSEEGDWAHINHKTLELRKLFPQKVLSQYNISEDSWGSTLQDWHKDHEGLTPQEAQFEYLKIAQQLAMYGVNYFPTKFNRVRIWIGIHPKGINIYENSLLVPTTSLKWIFIRMVHYSCRKFIIKTLMETIPNYEFQMKNLRSARQVFELAIGYHHIHIKNRHIPVMIIVKNEDIDKEKFKESTEEVCSGAVQKAMRFSEGWRKQLRRQLGAYRKLSPLQEEEPTDNVS